MSITRKTLKALPPLVLTAGAMKYLGVYAYTTDMTTPSIMLTGLLWLTLAFIVYEAPKQVLRAIRRKCRRKRTPRLN